VSLVANSLCEVVGEEVLLTVPAFVILTREEAAYGGGERQPAGTQPHHSHHH